MARSNTQLFVKGHKAPWAEVKTDVNGIMMVLVHNFVHPEAEPMYISIPSSGLAEQLANAICDAESRYQDAEEVE